MKNVTKQVKYRLGITKNSNCELSDSSISTLNEKIEIKL
jgi:hypothetical protein